MTELHLITDIDCLMDWRREVLGCVFGAEPDAALLAANREYYRRHLSDGSHRAFIAVHDGCEAGCGAVCYYDEMPSPDNPTGRCAYIMNVYVRRQFRHEGIATEVVGHLVDEARASGCGKIYLEATDMGRNMYAGAGFTDMKNFMKYGG